MNDNTKNIITFLLTQRFQYWWLILKVFGIITAILGMLLRFILRLNLKKCICIAIIVGLLSTSGLFAKSYSTYKSYMEQGTKKVTAVSSQLKSTLNKMHINY